MRKFSGEHIMPCYDFGCLLMKKNITAIITTTVTTIANKIIGTTTITLHQQWGLGILFFCFIVYFRCHHLITEGLQAL